MYQSPQTSYTQPPAPTHQYSQSQPWHPPAAPQPPPRPTEFHHFEHSAPPLPPKPELRSISTNSSGSWSGAEVINSPALQTAPHYWPPHPPADSSGMGHRTYTSPMISSSSAPRIGGAIPPEQARFLDSARFTESEQVASPPRPQQMAVGQSPEMGPYALVPPTPQMRGVTPMPQSPYLSSVPRTVEGSSPPQASMSPPFKPPPQSYFGPPSSMPPPPPPPLANRPYTATPAPPNHSQLPPHPPHLPPPPPPLPTHHSEPQLHTHQSHTPAPNSSQARHLSLPPLPPPTPAPSHPPPVSTPALGIPPPPTMPVPSFPQPFAAPSAPMHTGTQGWVGGIAPRPNAHFRPHYQPDWNNMPPIPQEFPAPPPPPRPPATPAPPAPAVSAPAIQMPTPVVPPPPPPLPPHPKHAATSPTVLTHGQWLGGLQRSGTVSSSAPPLPPKEPALPPNEHVSPPNEHLRSFQQDPPLPPKEPIPPLFPTASAAGGASPRLSPPFPHATTLEEQHEAELREAMRMSLAVSPRSEEEEDPELARALRESMRETSIRSADSGSNSETSTGLNLGSGAWTPVLPRAESPEVESVYQARPPPPLPSQPPAAMPATPPQETISETHVTASPAAEAQALDEDGPPPPTYEEVTGSQTATPAVAPSAPLPPTMPEPILAAPILGSVSPRERNTQNNPEAHSPPNMSVSAPEPPVAIEVTPPSANNSLARRGHPGRLERSSSEGGRPTRVSDEISTTPPPRRSTQSPPHGTARARATSQSRPSTEPPRQSELPLGSARPRVSSASLASSSSSPASRLSRASMFFGMQGSGLSMGSNDPPPRRTWAIDEEPGTGNGLLLQAPEPPISLLRSRNTSEVNLQEGLADAPPSDTLLDGVVYGFRDPDPPTPVPMPPANPPPPNISLDDSGAFHIQTLNFRHLLRLLSHYGSTSLMATPAAIAASKSGIHSARVVLHFVRGPHERDPWFCRLFLELHTPPERETMGSPDTTLPHPGTKIIAPVGPRGKLYVVPGPLPQLPLSFQGLSIFLISRLEEARRAPSDSTQRRLERILIECYGSVTGAAVTNEEIGGRQKGSGNLRSLGGIFSKVMDKLSSDKPNGNVNDHTYDLISPFHLDEYPVR